VLKEVVMPAPSVLAEFRAAWLPHVSDGGLDRLIELLASNSPLLIHGSFTRCLPMGCLATHIAWHHPKTENLQTEAGVTWLTRVARLNPAMSSVILAWDRCGWRDWELRDALLRECRAEAERRQEFADSDCGELAAVC
jgi:hypothetical protein